MKKSLFIFSLILLCFAFLNKAHAQEFQNSNTACESELVLCSSTSLSCGAGGATSIRCKNASATADFNGDSFVDCAASAPGRTAISTPEPVAASVLINKGASATNCSSGTGSQFNTSLDYSFSSFTGASSGNFGSIVVGDINGSAFSDMEIPAIIGGSFHSAATAPSGAGGGFGADESAITTTAVNWQSGAQTISNTSQMDKTQALIDCNGTGGPLDLAIPVAESSPISEFFLNVLLNSGTGLAAVSSSIDTTLADGSSGNGIASIAVGDFNNDNIPDVAIVTGSSTHNVNNFLIIGINNGSCGFTFPATARVNLPATHGLGAGADVLPTSIAVGDFNGDGNLDVVVTEGASLAAGRGVHYYFGNGGSSTTLAFTSNTHVAFTGNPIDGSPTAITTGCFNNDNVVDVAATYIGPGTGGTGNVRVINSDGAGGLSSPLSLGFPAGTFVVAGGSAINGIDAADFDKQGGDDIIAIGTDFNDQSRRKAYVFMNALETIVASAGADQTTTSDVVQLTGTCAMNPADSTAVFAPTWTIVSPAAGGTLTNTTTLTPTLTVTTPGTYTVRLTCRSRCTDTAAATTNVTVTTAGGLFLEGDGVIGHGGCMMNSLAPFSISGMLMMFSGLGVLWSFRRQKK